MRKSNFRLMALIFLAVFGLIQIQPKEAKATVNSTVSKIVYVGDGTSTAFPFSYNVYLSTDLLVQKVVVATGVTTTLTLTTDYTVALTHAAPTPGTVTLLSALAVGTDLVITRNVPFTQLINISNYSPTPAATWNEAHDRGVMLSQQLLDKANRAVLLDPTQSTNLILPLASNGQCLGWSSGLLTNLTCSGGGGGGGGGSFSPPIPDSQIQSITSPNKVAGSALYSLTGIPSGAGVIPVANIDTGTTANKIVQLTSAAKYPAVDGSLITKIDGSNLLNLNNTPSGANALPVANGGLGATFATTAQGNLLYFSATGVLSALAPGTSGQILQTQGTGANPQWTSSATDFSLISTTTITSTATSANIGLTAGKRYHVIAEIDENNNDANAAGSILIQFNADTGSNYMHSGIGRTGGGTTVTENSNSVAGISFGLVFSGSATAGTTYLNFDIMPKASDTSIAGITGQSTTFDNATIRNYNFSGYYDGAAAITSFRFISSSSNFLGTVKVYQIN